MSWRLCKQPLTVRLSAGEARVIVLGGEAGVGKTSLLTRFANTAAERHSSRAYWPNPRVTAA